MKRPCLVCGAPSVSSRCGRHLLVGHKTPRPEYLTSEWRKLSRKMRDAQPWCTRCGSTSDLTLDHVVPLSKGGAAVPDESGVVVLCRKCNSSRGARTHARG